MRNIFKSQDEYDRWLHSSEVIYKIIKGETFNLLNQWPQEIRYDIDYENLIMLLVSSKKI
ncbi:hypothetical protein J6O48_01715 [bacterium]|nr:hypothetical protein [bacterium]